MFAFIWPTDYSYRLFILLWTVFILFIKIVCSLQWNAEVHPYGRRIHGDAPGLWKKWHPRRWSDRGAAEPKRFPTTKQRIICSVITFKNILTDLEACITIKQCTRLVNEQMQRSEGTGRISQWFLYWGIEIHLTSCSHTGHMSLSESRSE